MTDSDALTHLIQEADQDWGLAWKDEELARIEDGITQMLQLANEHDFELLVVIFPIDVSLRPGRYPPLAQIVYSKI